MASLAPPGGPPTSLDGDAVHVGSEIFTAVCTHVAVVDVEDVDLGSRLDFLHSGSVPAAVKE